MKNKKYSGHNVPFTAAADVASGEVVVVGELIGINSHDVVTGEEGIMDRTGVYEVEKEAVAFLQGDIVYYDAASKKADNDNLNPVLGYAYKSALAGDAKMLVILKGGAGQGF